MIRKTTVRSGLLGLWLGATLLAAPAAAGPLASAVLSFSSPVATRPDWPFQDIVGAGAVGAATSDLSAHLEGGASFVGTSSAELDQCSCWVPATGLRFTIGHNEAVVWNGGAAIAPFEAVVTPTWSGGLKLLDLPFQIGAPNSSSTSSFGVQLTAVGAAWTVGTAAITGTPSEVWTAKGSNSLTPGGVGTLALVSPISIFSNLGPVIPVFATLTLTYVPEPGTALLLGVGAAGLGGVARRKRSAPAA